MLPDRDIETIIKELGFFSEDSLTKISIPTNSEISNLIPQRHLHGSKYDHGTVVAVAGSQGMAGAASLVANSVLKSGSGMCYLVSPKSSLIPLSVKVTEPVILPAPEIDGALSFDALKVVHSVNDKAKSIVIGPGLSRNSETAKLVREICLNSTLPTVIDGDGLNSFINKIDLFKNCSNTIVTPHYGEWKRLFGELSTDPIERVDALLEVSVAYGLTIVFKGYPTIITTPDDGVVIMPVGNSGIATAGSGDVLAGVIGSLLSQGCSVTDAVVVGVALHGKAGDFAKERVGEHSLVATDILNELGSSFLWFKKE